MTCWSFISPPFKVMLFIQESEPLNDCYDVPFDPLLQPTSCPRPGYRPSNSMSRPDTLLPSECGPLLNP